MRRYTIAYAIWLSFVVAAGVIALYWYRKVEGIGMAEVFAHMREDDTHADDPETASVSEWGGAG